ncbi:GlxA family transcriptional regulator [Mycolicibacterium confluentis]|uniref:GlxA family transcriptional regulator n=1 Tax=Mycolicibacterium confluentis TaxID=28047 RepID=UPI000A153828|nr:GlxA family transcriptional regulator [Mycolicibacterium confluentis]ORV30815.1 AraC family transcriptional regulator [Mycolicibacterium confluentis]
MRHNGAVAAGGRSRVVVIIVFDDVTLLDVAGAGEVFAEANRFGADYRIKVASVDGQDVRTSIGIRLGVTDSIGSIESADTVLVAGSDALPARAIDPALVEAVKTLGGRTRRLGSICTGSFILAQAGLLSGRRATTHWQNTRSLARAFPDVTVEPDAIFVRDGDLFTSAGISSGIDLALALVEQDHGTDLVRDVARWLVVYLKRAGGQSQFSALIEANPPPQSALRVVTEAIAADPGENHSVRSLAARASLSTRQLTRLFRAELGMTPADYVEMVRIDVARAALDAGRTVTDTAHLAGFGSTETLRRAFVEHLGVPPKVYRDRFRSAIRT